MGRLSAEQMRQWMRDSDDAEAVEFPANFDYLATLREVEIIKPKIERIIGQELQIDRNVQDASFFTDLSWGQLSTDLRTWHTIFAVRFSAFGRLATIWNVCPETMKAPQEVFEGVIAELHASGFRYVDESLLYEHYNGLHPLFADANWYTRFFDYV